MKDKQKQVSKLKKDFTAHVSFPEWRGYDHADQIHSECFPKIVSIEKFNLTRVKGIPPRYT